MSAWEFYTTANGHALVSEEIQDLLPKQGRITLGALLQRIEDGETLRGDVKKLNKELWEARLTFDSQEYRLHYAPVKHGDDPLLLGLHAVNKKAQKASPQDIAVSEARLHDWKERHPSASPGRRRRR